jgi:hypothetical protein
MHHQRRDHLDEGCAKTHSLRISNDGAQLSGVTKSESDVGELRHDLSEQHELWLIEQYVEGSRR